MIIKVFTLGPLDTNGYLVGCPDTHQACIIDAPQGITQYILQETSWQIQALILTHSHWDHVVDAAQLKQTLQIPVYVHAQDEKNLKEPGSDQLPLFFPLAGTTADYHLKEGDHVDIGHLNFQVIETPGHSPGGVCFWLEKEKVLFSGDTLFCHSMGRIDFPHSNPSHMWNSLKKLAKLPGDTKVYPGHGETTTIGAERWINQAEQLFGVNDGRCE